jgi:hypothetical protein
VPDLLPEGVDGPDGFCAQMGFELCRGHFDRIKVGARSGLVEKDQLMRLKPHLRLACGGPFPARCFDAGTVLLARQQVFLKR